ncbi:hypothetical protein LXL04_008994 [Taraxacum kok-saghyz]
MIKLQNFFILLISILPSIQSQNRTNCDRSCPGGDFNPVRYPFGFSSGCEIQLNCTPQGDVLIGEFPIQQINSDGLLVSLPAMCGRAFNSLSHLYGENYAPTSTNAILMQNCTEQMKNCMIPMTDLRTHLEIVNCSGGDGGNYSNVSCYSGDLTGMFLDYKNMSGVGCRYLFSAVSTEFVGASSAVSLSMQVVKLGWWVKGACDCSSGANCTTIVSPSDGSHGYRCKCNSGFDGDGYKSSSGCRMHKDWNGY